MVGRADIYLDTSGVLAFLDADDVKHQLALGAWSGMMDLGSRFVMTDYVRLECWSLVQRRLGMDAVRSLSEQILPLCRIEVAGEDGFKLLSRQAILLNRKKLSLVDLSSFECMQRLGLKRALAFDKHFLERGFFTPEHTDW